MRKTLHGHVHCCAQLEEKKMPRGGLRSSKQRRKETPIPILTVLLMLTSRQSAPFGVARTRVRSQPSRRAPLDVKIIRRIAEIEFEMLNIVHDHYDQDLPTLTPLFAPKQGTGDGTQVYDTCVPPPEPDDHSGGLGHTVRELMKRSHADRLSSHADKTEHDHEQREISTTTSGPLKARVTRPCRGTVRIIDSKPTFDCESSPYSVARHRQHADVPIGTIML